MKINLRKANAIQHEIRHVLNSLSSEVYISVSQFEDAEAAIEKARETYFETKERRASLLDSLYEIRKKTASANMVSGINDALNRVAEIDTSLHILNKDKSSNHLRLDAPILKGKLEKLKTSSSDKGDYIYDRDSVDTGIFNQDDLDRMTEEVHEFKREKRDLQDKLLELNVATSISLSDTAMTCLKKEGIL